MTLSPMHVDTVLGVLSVAPPPVRTAADLTTYASAVRLCAKDMTALVGRAPGPLRPSVRMLGRSWCGDMQAQDALRAVETGNLAVVAQVQAAIGDMREVTPHSIAMAHDLAADGARRGTTLLRRVGAALARGDSAGAAALVKQAWSARVASPLTGGDGVVSVGAWRAHTGCVCKGIESGGACTCGACSPLAQAGVNPAMLEDEE